MRTVGSLVPFAASATPASAPPAPQVVSIASGSGGKVVFITFDTPIVSGPTTAYTSWLVGSGGPVDPPTGITLVAGGIRVENSTWTVPPNNQVEYTGAGAPYQTALGGTLQPFLLSLPYP